MSPRLAVPAVLVILLLTTACTPDDAVDATPETEAAATPTGRLVIIGGGLNAENADVYRAFLGARQGDGPLCVIPTAGGDPAGSIASMVARIDSYAGEGSAVGIPISTGDPSLAYDSATVADMMGCSGFYFTGGSQSRVIDVFLPQGDTTPAYRALWDRWQAGAVVAGSSAGAAMMARVMIAGGGSDEAVANGVAVDGGDGVNITNGMGLFPQAHLDQHFLARGRVGRLLVATLATDSLPVGLGIDENTALVVDADTAVVVGASGVVVVDARRAEGRGTHRGTGLRVTLAGAGDVVDLRTFEVRRGAGKQAIPETDGAVTLPEDPFARWAFLQLAVDLASSTDTEATFTPGGAVLTLREADGFSAAFGAPQGGVQETPLGFSAGPFMVDLVEGSERPG